MPRLLLTYLTALAFLPMLANAQTFSDAAAPNTPGTVSALRNGAAAAPQASSAAAPGFGPFDLISQNNSRVTAAAFKGSWRLLTFGYTRCGDYCTPSLAAMLQALGQLPAAQAGRVLPVFVTLDPARDNPAALKAFLTPYGSRIVGLTGTPGAIDRMARDYGVSYRQVENPDAAIERSLTPQDLDDLRRDPSYQRDPELYMLDHTSMIYLLDPDGKFVSAINGSLPAAEIAKRLQAAIQ